MENAQEVLVVFLSTALAIFLLLSIMLLIICIKIANHIKRISEKAEAITDRAEDIADFFSKAGTPMALGKVIGSVMDAVRGRGRQKRGGKDD
ncbi:MAG TPA: hypothetical protein VK674_00725 [Candidatus Limnocylindria bacterium]|nr:hypothetical protein [Candidatus Limnocylindria bacterium]